MKVNIAILFWALLPLAAAVRAQQPIVEGAEFQVNSYATDNQRRSSVAVDAGGFVVVWQSDGSVGSDDSMYSIQGTAF